MAADNKLSVEGRPYTFLPLPSASGLPVHVNANFALSDNRRTLLSDQGGELVGEAVLRARWNDALLLSLLPSLYAEVLSMRADSLSAAMSKAATSPGKEAGGDVIGALAELARATEADGSGSITTGFYQHWPTLDRMSKGGAGVDSRFRGLATETLKRCTENRALIWYAVPWPLPGCLLFPAPRFPSPCLSTVRPCRDI